MTETLLPGPWVVDAAGDVLTKAGRTVAVPGNAFAREEGAALARLLAAVPQLLELARRVADPFFDAPGYVMVSARTVLAAIGDLSPLEARHG